VDSGSANESTTRYLETTRGPLSYLAVADIVAGYLADLLDEIASGAYAKRRVDCELVLEFHRRILEPIVPKMAGKWRPMDVVVGHHLPPHYYQVPVLMRECCANVQAQVDWCGTDVDRQVEVLAYCEGQMLTIHPFEDFNGRAIRAVLTEMMTRMDLPPLEISVPRDTAKFNAYTSALRAYDGGDVKPLREFWISRFEADI
jgi:fido (protein-threonine AMPylation protein)